MQSPLREFSYHLKQILANRRLNTAAQPDVEPVSDEGEPGGEPEPMDEVDDETQERLPAEEAVPLASLVETASER